MIIHLLWIFSGFIVCLFFIYFCVTHGKKPGERFLARLNWLQVIRLADMQALFFGGKDEGRRNKYRTIDIRHSDQDRDDWKLLMMLEEEGDFRIFTGVEYSEKYRDDFLDYFEVTHGNRCYYSLFPKEDPEKFIGYAGFHTSFVRRSGFWKNLVL